MALPGGAMDVDMPDIASLSVDREEDDSDGDGSSESLPQDLDRNSQNILENDRSYADNSYPFPCDTDEALRLSVTHQAFTLLLDGKLNLTYLSPTTPLRILDIGTGPGDWALAAALKYPHSTVLATDLNPAMGSAADHDIPSNLTFQIDDARTLPWTFEPNHFDFVHVRGLGGAFTEPELEGIYAEIFRCLKPGGQLEMSDFGQIAVGGLPSSPPASSAASPSSSPPAAVRSSSSPSPEQGNLIVYNTSLQAACESRGLLGLLNLRHASTELLERVGFRVQRCLRPAVALGEWSSNPRDHRVGRMAAVAMLEGLEARALRLLTRELSWTKDAVRGLVERVKSEVQAPGARPSVQAQIVVARKLTL